MDKLLTDLELGDKKPTQLLREMRNLAGNRVSDDILCSLWIKRMPTNVRCILSASKEVALTPLADLADRILENSTASCVMVTSSRSPQDVSNKEASSLETRVTALEKNLAELVETLKTNNDRGSRFRSGSCNRKIKNRDKSPAGKSGYCYYHHKFGKEAEHCTSPCIFFTQNEQGN